ncbi:MAG: hypothetical protein J7J76_03490 [Candidatus Latescibacteria bacterium]|nr:hypothetical protein [Candidatus Latescibacterota bacterium]
MGISEALATMTTGKLIALGIFGVIALGIIVGAIIATSAVLGPGRRAVGGALREEKRMPTSIRVLGWGICLLSVGLGIIMAMYVLPSLSAWGIIGMALLCGGLGLVVFYLIASRREKFPENKAPESAERGE